MHSAALSVYGRPSNVFRLVFDSLLSVGFALPRDLNPAVTTLIPESTPQARRNDESGVQVAREREPYRDGRPKMVDQKYPESLSRLGQYTATVDYDHRPSAETLSHQIKICFREIFRFSDSPDRQRSSDLFEQFISLLLGHISPEVSSNYPGANEIHPYRSQLDCQCTANCFNRTGNCCCDDPSFLRTQADDAIGQDDRPGRADSPGSMLCRRDRTPESSLEKSAGSFQIDSRKLTQIQGFADRDCR